MNNSFKYTAVDLLKKVIEFTNMTPNPEEWTFEKQVDNDPRFVRLQQIQALIWAFIPELLCSKGIRENIESFYSGEFIQTRQIEDYGRLLDNMDKTISKSSFYDAPKEKIDLNDLQDNYRDLLNYYLKLNNLLSHNKGMMEISYPYFFPYLVTNSISDSMGPKLRKLRSIITLLIDPFKQRFTEAKLVKEFDFPKEDLFEIDLDWM